MGNFHLISLKTILILHCNQKLIQIIFFELTNLIFNCLF